MELAGDVELVDDMELVDDAMLVEFEAEVDTRLEVVKLVGPPVMMEDPEVEEKAIVVFANADLLEVEGSEDIDTVRGDP